MSSVSGPESPTADRPTAPSSDDNLTQTKSGNTTTSVPPEKKRRRPPLACEQCRKRKIRCDRKSPCNHCVKTKVSTCTYATSHAPAPRSKKTSPPNIHPASAGAFTSVPSSAKPLSLPLHTIDQVRPRPGEYGRPISAPIPTWKSSSSAPSSTPGSSSDASTVERLLARISVLEEELGNPSHPQRPPGGEPLQPGGGGASFTKGSLMKTRYFGDSHWMNGADMMPVELGIFARMEQDHGELHQVISRSKTLARRIKDARLKPLNSTNLANDLPARGVCDALVDIYLRNFEGMFRIVHIPRFLADYERFWADRSSVSEAFVIQLQLCMAIGATIWDETFSLRNAATQWVYEARVWLMLPPEKSRMTLTGLQIQCLIVLARTTCGVSSDLSWTTSGSLVRTAMFMGFHRDPIHLPSRMTTYTTQMRRRLWATILELNLQSAFDSGGAPLLSGIDYDTLPPANMHDEQLVDEMNDHVEEQHADVQTQTSVQLALLRSLPLRVALLRHVNEFRSSNSYEETLRLNSQLTKASRILSSNLMILSGKPSPHMTYPISLFHIYCAEICMYRCFHAIHQPVVLRHLEDPKYYFSRKMQLDCASQVAHRLGLAGPSSDDAAAAAFRRLCTNGSGMFRSIPMQSLLAITIELIHHTEEQTTSLGYLPSIGEADLRDITVKARDWSLERIRSGETNVKGHTFISGCLAHLDAINAGDDLTGIEAAILREAGLSAQLCLEVLTEVARNNGVSTDEAATNEPMDMELFPETWMDWMGDVAWDDMSRFSGVPPDDINVMMPPTM